MSYSNAYYNDFVRTDTVEDVNKYSNSNNYTSHISSVDRVLIKLDNSQGQYSHILLPYGVDGHCVTSEAGENTKGLNTVTLTALNGLAPFRGQMVNITYTQYTDGYVVTGFYYLWFNHENYNYDLIPCAHPPNGYLQVLQTINCHITTVQLMLCFIMIGI